MKRQKQSWKLTKSERAFFKEFSERKAREGVPQVLWGWKRDKVVDGVRFPESRTVYFSADLGLERSSELVIKRAYFFLENRAERNEIAALWDEVGESRTIDGYKMRVAFRKDRGESGYARLRIEIGEPTLHDTKTVARRLRGKPRLRIDPPRLIPEFHDYDLRGFAPFALYCGSGLSAESGLPFLALIHTVFEVDDPKKGELIFGSRDRLLVRVVRDVEGAFRKFSDFTVQAIKARPSSSHRILQRLHQERIVRQAFTDNVDDILQKVGIPYTQTRLSIFPDRFPATFDPRARSLLVIGISVDRRDVVRQARRRGLSIVVVNPVLGVAPHSRNVDYMRRGDIFFRGEAREVLPKIVSASGF